ncbi:MAG: hypothetical protein N2484_00035 [Clostridia bacterium]|nr:hypothetical protein [Clostridia bacterium]
MDENFGGGSNHTNHREDKGEHQNNISNIEKSNPQIHNYTMDRHGNIHDGGPGDGALLAAPKTFIVLGWISAALTLLITPYFAVAGITFGLLANRRARGTGNYVIITNIVLAILSFAFGILSMAIRRTVLGY